jgi:hypothetical protein
MVTKMGQGRWRWADASSAFSSARTLSASWELRHPPQLAANYLRVSHEKTAMLEMDVRSGGAFAPLVGYWHEGHCSLAACGVAENADAMVVLAVDANAVRAAVEVAVYAFAIDSAGFGAVGSGDEDAVGDGDGLGAAADVENENRRLPGGSQGAPNDGSPVPDEKTLSVPGCWTMTGEI